MLKARKKFENSTEWDNISYFAKRMFFVYLSIYILMKLWSPCMIGWLIDWLRPCVDSIIQGFSRPVMKVGRIIYSSASNSTFKVKFLFGQWLNFLGQNDSILSLGALREKLSHFDLKSWVKFFFASNSTFRSKWLIFFSRCTERKIESFWPKKLGQIFVPPVFNFSGQILVPPVQFQMLVKFGLNLTQRVTGSLVLYKDQERALPRKRILYCILLFNKCQSNIVITLARHQSHKFCTVTFQF